MSTTLRAALTQLKPTADAALDAQLADVIGIKADTVAGTSLVALSKFIKTRGRQITTRATATLPQTANLGLFTVTGKINLIQIIGTFTVEHAGAANNTKLKFNPAGAGSDTDLCAVVETNGAAVGTTLTITGTLANAAVLSADIPVIKQATQILLPSGVIELDCNASRTGSISWVLVWEPVDADATVVAVAIP